MHRMCGVSHHGRGFGYPWPAGPHWERHRPARAKSEGTGRNPGSRDIGPPARVLCEPASSSRAAEPATPGPERLFQPLHTSEDPGRRPHPGALVSTLTGAVEKPLSVSFTSN